MNWILFIRRYADIKERSDIPLCAIFGWTTRGVSRSLSHARPDVATGSPTLMHALYLLGAGRIRLLVVRVNRVECHEVGRTPVPHVRGDDDRSVEVASSEKVQRVHEGR